MDLRIFFARASLIAGSCALGCSGGSDHGGKPPSDSTGGSGGASTGGRAATSGGNRAAGGATGGTASAGGAASTGGSASSGGSTAGGTDGNGADAGAGPDAGVFETLGNPWGLAPSASSSRAFRTWMPKIAASGAGWVRGFDEAQLEGVLTTAAANGLQVTGILQWAPEGSPLAFPVADLPGWKAHVARIRITAVLRRNGADNAGFNLKYESASGYRGTGAWYTVPEGTAWVTQSWTVTDPQFVGKWGYNFSFDSDSTTHSKYSLRSVTVTKE